MHSPTHTGAESVWTNNALLVNLHLFFLRIMKEHSLFLEAGFTPRDKRLAAQAGEFKKAFDGLLAQTIAVADGIVSQKAMESGQFITPFTAQAERLTSHFTGIPVDSNITVRERGIKSAEGAPQLRGAEAKIRTLNQNACRLTGELKDFKKKLLSDAVNCRIMTGNYPAELHHMYNEAEHYLHLQDELDRGENIMRAGHVAPEEAFWSEIMAEHNKAAAGKLDPTEEEAIEKSLMFAKEFDELKSRVKISLLHMEPQAAVTRDARNMTKQLQEFQIDGMKGMFNCDIQSILLPLRQDHHIRETYYFIWVLDMDAMIHMKQS